MKVTLINEGRFLRTPDGAVWTPSQRPYKFWTRYLEVFDHVTVVARVQDVDKVSSNYRQANGYKVSFDGLVYYRGAAQFLACHRKLRQKIVSALAGAQAVILRGAAFTSNMVVKELLRHERPYGLEVGSHPYNEYAPLAFKHPLRPLIRFWFDLNLKRHCRTAAATAYVTKHILQDRYPPGPAPSFCPTSDVELTDEDFSDFPRHTPSNIDKYTLIHVGSMETPTKGHDIAIKAVSRCIQSGLNCRLKLIGDGRLRPSLEELARNLSIADRVEFLGELPSPWHVRIELEKAHLFVFPSMSEGKPRALLEAMAVGLPSIGSSVGGILELLPAEDMISPGNVDELFMMIVETLRDPRRMEMMSRNNRQKAREYHTDIITKIRLAFYTEVKERTAIWLKGKNKGVAL